MSGAEIVCVGELIKKYAIQGASLVIQAGDVSYYPVIGTIQHCGETSFLTLVLKNGVTDAQVHQWSWYLFTGAVEGGCLKLIQKDNVAQPYRHHGMTVETIVVKPPVY